MRITLLCSLLATFLLWGCEASFPTSMEETEQEVSETQVTSRSELGVLGKVIDGRFIFTVSDDQLSSNYASNTAAIFGEPGEMTSATVELPSEENGEENPVFYLDGMVSDGNSALLRSEASFSEDAEGGIIVVLPMVIQGLYCSGCSACRYRPGPYCKCVAAPGNPCPKGGIVYNWDLPTD